MNITISKIHVIVLDYLADISGEREPVVGARFSRMRQDLPEFSPETASTDFRSKIIFSLKPRNKISPHTVLGMINILYGI